MNPSLSPCPVCHRHVRASESVCPFCTRGLPVASVRPTVTTRLSRAALVALGATLAGCGSTVTSVDGATLTDASLTDTPADRGNFAPPYGIAPFDAGLADASAPADQGNVVQPYGTPPPPLDAGTDAQNPADLGTFAPPYGVPVRDAGTDAQPTDAGNFAPPYGTPPSTDV